MEKPTVSAVGFFMSAALLDIPLLFFTSLICTACNGKSLLQFALSLQVQEDARVFLGFRLTTVSHGER